MLEHARVYCAIGVNVHRDAKGPDLPYISLQGSLGVSESSASGLEFRV